MKPIAKNFALTCAMALVLPCAVHSAPIIFDDFNVNEGHFTSAPNFSGTTVGEDASSTADRVTTNTPREGAGHQKIVLVHDATTTPLRLRHLSGGGTVGNNVSFATTSGTDGKIGFYLKTTATGWETSINLDGPAGTAADMDGSISLPVIGDGEWHLYEWDLDDNSHWTSVPSIGGGHGGLVDTTHTIDSIYLRDLDGSPGPTAEIYLDFVALNPAGSVADLLSNPCLNTSGVLVTGPLSVNSNQVYVTGVSASATALKVYQDSGSGMQSIGVKTTGIVAGTNVVTVSGLVKGAIVGATQTIAGQESCVPTTGKLVGGGANPALLVAFSIRESSATGPVGTNGTGTGNANIHFLGSSVRYSAAPGNGALLQPSNGWQTVTFQRGVDPSICWNGTIDATSIPGDWGILDSLALAVGDVTDSGPYDLYIDALQNGTTVFEDFEAIETGTNANNYGFWYPSFAGQSQNAVLDNPNETVLSANTAFSGGQSLRVRFQWAGLDNSKVVRLSTSAPPKGIPSPLVNLNEPITVRFLLLPVGATPPPPPGGAPTLAYSINAGQITFTWTGTYNLQETSTLGGTWNTVSSASGYQAATGSGTKFYRLVSP